MRLKTRAKLWFIKWDLKRKITYPVMKKVRAFVDWVKGFNR